MISLPIIHLIHASDAPQHLAELKAILLRMKSDNRISDVVALDVNASPFSISFENNESRSIILLLTHEVEYIRKELETQLKNITQKNYIKLIEIIVDNIPYNNTFISFPDDLMPIRTRDDMNQVWNSIERDLMILFPKAPAPIVNPAPASQTASKPTLKLIGVSIATLMLCVLIIFIVMPRISDAAFLILCISGLIIPITIFKLNQRSLTLCASLPGEKEIGGSINWTKYFKEVALAILILFASVIIWNIILINMGLNPSPVAPPLLAGFTTFVILIVNGQRRRKRIKTPT